MVTVYAAGPVCEGAQRALNDRGGRAGSVRVRVRCLPSTGQPGRYDLAQIGANARRATEDSTTVGYIGETEPHARLFSAPILEAAGIAQLSGESGSQAMEEILQAIAATSETEGVRESVYGQLG